MTHQELASRLGTVREVVSRNLARFRADGLIRIQGHQVEIVDAAGLQAEAEAQVESAMNPPYSARKASTGSTRVALRAGR
jgi:DNA-binding transcriptional regulator LsrR (DeoR family)